MASAIPLGRLGEPEEIVQAMLWACAKENSFFTGQAIALDGGLGAG
jgi:NAD(P)-dependent dehydrogenase (short-subunit alcohol dehydrogenase family)